VHPPAGHLNTKFGIKSLQNGDSKYKVSFETNVETDWIDNQSFIYYQFKTPGVKNITIELESGEKVTKNIIVNDTVSFGTGKTLKILLLEKSKKILIIKSIGLIIHDILTEQEYPLDITINHIDTTSELSNNRLLIISKHKNISKIGVLDLSNGVFIYELDCIVKEFSVDKKIAIMIHDDCIKIIRFYKDIPIISELKGDFIHSDIQSMRVFYKNENSRLVCYNIGSYKDTYLGDYDYKNTIGENNRFIVCNDSSYSNIWDTIENDFVFYFDKSQQVVIYNKNNFLSYFSNWSVRKKEDEKSRFGVQDKYEIEILPNDKYSVFVVKYPDKYQIVEYNFKSIDFTDVTGDGEFLGWMGEGKYYIVSDSDINKICLSNSNELVFETMDSISDIIFYKNKWIAIINKKNSVLILNLKSKKVLFEEEGYFETKYLDKIKKYDQLWIKRKRYSSDFRIINSNSYKKLKDICLVKNVDDFIITNDRVLRCKNLNTIKVIEINKGYLQYNENLDYIITKDINGFNLLTNILGREKVSYNKFQELDKIYDYSDIHPEERIAVLTSNNQSEIINLDTNEVIKVLDTNFIKFDINGNMFCSNRTDVNKYQMYWGTPKVYNPLTFEEVEPSHLHKYKFTSIDGKYGISLMYKGMYELVDLETNKIILEIENKHPGLDWTNYIAFHPFYSIIAIVGKVSYSNGITKILKFSDYGEKSVAYYKDIQYSRNAVWKCGFTNDGKYLASFDSGPITSVYQITSNGKLYEKRQIKDRSFKCFSPDSKYIVLGDDGYSAITAGGHGWAKSNNLWVESILSGAEINQFSDHKANIVFANFSKNGRHLVSRSDDGIVIIRKLF
jgi:hypothetical protein